MTSQSDPVALSSGSASRRVAEEITDVILRDLTPGAQIPSEAELAEQYQVSRVTVREALKVLTGRGLIEVGRGRRATVREPSGASFGEFLSAAMKHDPKGLFDLLEVRQALEIQSASSAARHVNRAGLAAVEHALNGMQEAARRIREQDGSTDAERDFFDFDVGFHEALALCSGNRMLAYLIEAMAAPLRDSFVFSMQGNELRGHTREDTIAAHARIFEAVRAGDSRRAAQDMRSHLKDSERDIRAALRAQLSPIKGA